MLRAKSGCVARCMIALTFGSLFASVSDADTTNGLVARYRLDGDASDSVAGRNGTIVGNVLPTAGVVGSAMSFDGASHIRADATGLPVADRTTAYWFNANTFSTNPAPFGYGGSGCSDSWFSGVYTPGHWLYVSSHCGANTLIHTYITLSVLSWHHFAATVSPAGTKIYLDGQQVASNDTYVTNTFVEGKDLSLGVIPSPSGIAPYVDGNVGYLEGRMDDVRIYDRALSDQEIAELPEPGLNLMILWGSCAVAALSRTRGRCLTVRAWS